MRDEELAETGDLGDLIADNDLTGVRLWLAEHPPYEIADELERMDSRLAIVPFRLLDKEPAAAVFDLLSLKDEVRLLQDDHIGEGFFVIIVVADDQLNCDLYGNTPPAG
jgi:Mg/Co/Ni transporter MgtE